MERPAHCTHLYEANFGFQRLDGSNALQRSGVRGHFFGQSSFATRSLATERNLVQVPKDLPLEVLAPLGCGLQTGAGTVINSLQVPAGASIAVFGTGAVGLAAVMAARLVGAKPIIGVDIRPKRLKLGLSWDRPTRSTVGVKILPPALPGSPAAGSITSWRQRASRRCTGSPSTC